MAKRTAIRAIIYQTADKERDELGRFKSNPGDSHYPLEEWRVFRLGLALLPTSRDLTLLISLLSWSAIAQMQAVKIICIWSEGNRKE